MAGSTPPAFLPFVAANERELTAFIRAFHAEDGHPIDDLALERTMQALRTHEPLLHLWMIGVEGAAVGYVALALGFSIEVGGLDAFVDELYVAPEVRGQGLGRSALGFVELAASRLGVRRLCLEVETRNHRARALYQGCGYAVHSRRLMSKWV